VIRRVLAIAVALAASAAIAHAQRPKADVTPIAERDAVHAGTDVRLALQVRLPVGLHMQSNKPRDPLFIPTALSIDAPAGVTVAEIVFPPSTDLKQEGQAQPLAVFEREFAIGVRVTLAPNIAAGAAGDLAIPVRMRYQACDEKVCYLPQRAEASWTLHIVPATAPTPASVQAEAFGKIAFGKGETVGAELARPGNPATSPRPPATVEDAAFDGFETAGQPKGGYMPSGEFLQFIHDSENGVTRRGLFEGHGTLAILLIIFLGGLALNLTPCVLPMIPINLAIIGAGAQAGSRARGFLLGATYGAAMAVVYGVLGLVVILTAGTFGTINASPWFNGAIAVLFVFLALAMFDVVTIDFSGLSSGFRAGESSRGTFLLAFGMGGVAALLAGACVAPVVIEVVLFSSNLYAKGTTLALALPFFLGVGMAVPWPLAGAGIASLPRPGAWMVRVKQVFGVLILVTALYYGYEAYIIVANRWVDPAVVASSVQEQLKAGWESSLADGLAAARREHKPVLIDMWATWCKNCLTMDQTTLKDPAVKAALAGYVKIKFQAEDPDDPTTKAVMKRFDAVGLPTYVILRPGP
jgi:thiol:disulfide interchange protein DsbD